MINGKDLRIGNSVWESSIVDPGLEDFEEIIIASINDIDKVVHDEQDNIYSYDYLYPIPITTEWLEKLGFMKEVNNVWLNTPLKIGINAGGSVSWVYYFDRHLSLTQLKYVDQLQNLYFALTGEELTINNVNFKTTS